MRSSFMPLYVDRLVTDVEFCNLIGDVFSLAHYYKQNGVMVPDPDMTFICIKDVNRVYPLTFQDYRTYQEALFVGNGNNFTMVRLKAGRSSERMAKTVIEWA